jgi:hypothetical protein
MAENQYWCFTLNAEETYALKYDLTDRAVGLVMDPYWANTPNFASLYSGYHWCNVGTKSALESIKYCLPTLTYCYSHSFNPTIITRIGTSNPLSTARPVKAQNAILGLG